MSNAKQISVKELEKMSNSELAEANLDDLNLESIIKNRLTSKKKSESTKIDLYKGTNKVPYIEMDKKTKNKFRKQTRNQRNSFLDSFLRLQNSKNIVGIKKEFKVFKSFYIERYNVNDFTVESFARGNSDDETIIDLKIVLSILKKNNLIK